MSEITELIEEKIGVEVEEMPEGEPGLKIRVDNDKLINTLKSLRGIGYNYMTMLTAKCTDDSFDAIYLLDDWTHKRRIWVYTEVNVENPSIPSITPSWLAADYLEREVYDMFGIEFEGHPNLTRILTPEGFNQYPLRKEFKESD
jgi:NADH-quinone oxidoreductase subunit C